MKAQRGEWSPAALFGDCSRLKPCQAAPVRNASGRVLIAEVPSVPAAIGDLAAIKLDSLSLSDRSCCALLRFSGVMPLQRILDPCVHRGLFRRSEARGNLHRTSATDVWARRSRGLLAATPPRRPEGSRNLGASCRTWAFLLTPRFAMRQKFAFPCQRVAHDRSQVV